MTEIWSIWVNRSETTAFTARDNEVIVADISQKVKNEYASFPRAVLPGPEEDLCGIFLIIDCKIKTQFFSNVNRFSLFFSIKTCDIKFRYISATFGLKDSVTRFSTLGFFLQSITPRPLINTQKYFRILFRIRRAIRPLSPIARDHGQ
jgi:hypothetical protein